MQYAPIFENWCESRDVEATESSLTDSETLDTSTSSARSSVVPVEYGEGKRTVPVPIWVCDEEAMCVQSRQFGAFVVGPAVPWLYKATVLTGLSWILTPAIAYAFSSCRTDGLAHVPLWVYALACIPISMVICIEQKVRTYTLIPQLIRARELERSFRLLCVPLPFYLWLLNAVVLTMFSHADIITSGIFVGKAAATDMCTHVEGVVSVRETWLQSMKTSPTLWWLGEVPFSVVGLIGWLLMSVQGIYGLMLTPICSSNVYNTLDPEKRMSAHYELVNDIKDPRMMSFDTLLGSNLNMWVSAQALGDLNRMVSVTEQSITYTQGLGHSNAGILATYIGAESTRRMISFAVFQLLESGYQLNLQCAGLALFKAVSPQNEVDTATLVSLGVGFCVACGSSTVKIRNLWFYYTFTRDHEIEDLAEGTVPANTVNRESKIETQIEKIEDNFRQVLRSGCISIILVIFLACLLIRAASQTYMAVAVCEQGLHNMFEGDHCVVLQGMID